MKGLMIPKARKEELVVQEVSDEVLVYDLRTNRAHCLNETAAFVWKSCDGKNSVEEIGKKCQRDSGKPVSEEMIWLAIEQLGKRELLEKPVEVVFEGQTRREALKRIGLGAMIALPIVTSLTAPTAALAGTICANPACVCTFTPERPPVSSWTRNAVVAPGGRYVMPRTRPRRAAASMC